MMNIKNILFILLIIIILICVFQYTKNIETFNRCRIKSVDLASQENVSIRNKERVIIDNIEKFTKNFFVEFFKWSNAPKRPKLMDIVFTFFCNNSKVSYGSNIDDTLENYFTKIEEISKINTEAGDIFPQVTCIDQNITKKFPEQFVEEDIPLWFIDNSGCVTEGQGQLVGTTLNGWNAQDISGWRECIEECDKKIDCYGATTNNFKKCSLIGSDLNVNTPIDISWNYWRKEQTCKVKSSSFDVNKYFYENNVSVKLINPSSKVIQTMNFYLKYIIKNKKPCIIKLIDKDNKLANKIDSDGIREVKCPDNKIFNYQTMRCEKEYE